MVKGQIELEDYICKQMDGLLIAFKKVMEEAGRVNKKGRTPLYLFD